VPSLLRWIVVSLANLYRGRFANSDSIRPGIPI
jgi:hypothetical protein